MSDLVDPLAARDAARRLVARLGTGDPPATADLAPLIGADRAGGLDAVDRAALGGHLRALALDGPGIARLLADERVVAAVLRLRRGLVARLVECATGNKPLSWPLRHAFGVLSPLHEQVLTGAVADGVLTRAELMSAVFDGPALTQLLRDRPVTVPLEFDTTVGTAPAGRSEAILRTDTPYAVTTPHGGFTVLVANGTELWRAATLATKEPDLITLLDDTLRTGDVLFDVGASIGLYTLWALHLGRGVRVVAIEPEPLSFARLNENLWLNGFTDGMALPVALHDHDGVATFHSRSFVAGAASPFGTDVRSGSTATHHLGCVTMPLDGLLAMAGALPFPTHLKIDVDGPQRAVLAGAAGTLADRRLRHVLVEVFEDELPVITAQLGAAGLECVGLRWSSQRPTEHGRVGNARFDRLTTTSC